MILATALRFFSRMGSLKLLEMLESEHHLVAALSVESWIVLLQMIKKTHQGMESRLGSRNGVPSE